MKPVKLPLSLSWFADGIGPVMVPLVMLKLVAQAKCIASSPLNMNDDDDE